MAELHNNMVCGDFSTSDEIDTGETWVDGKKIYRRTYITTQSVGAGVSFEIPVGLESVADTIWIDQQNSYIRTTSGNIVYPIPLEHYNSGNDYIGVWCNSASIRLYSNGGWGTGWEKCVTIRYTKKSPNAYNI